MLFPPHRNATVSPSAASKVKTSSLKQSLMLNELPNSVSAGR
jgi:hypothetical protein